MLSQQEPWKLGNDCWAPIYVMGQCTPVECRSLAWKPTVRIKASDLKTGWQPRTDISLWVSPCGSSTHQFIHGSSGCSAQVVEVQASGVRGGRRRGALSKLWNCSVEPQASCQSVLTCGYGHPRGPAAPPQSPWPYIDFYPLT